MCVIISTNNYNLFRIMRNFEELKSMTQEDLVRLARELEETIDNLERELKNVKADYDSLFTRYYKLRSTLQNVLDLSC